MSSVDSKKQNLIEEIKKNKSMCQNIEAELKIQKSTLSSLDKNAGEISKKMDALNLANQVLTADIELNKAKSAQTDFQIAQTKAEIEKIMVDILTIEDECKQCELNTKLFEQTSVSLKEQVKHL